MRLNGLPPTRGHSSYRLVLSNADPSNVLVVSQLVDVRNLINQSLDVVDVSTWTGDPRNANFIAGQLRLLVDNIHDACEGLRGVDDRRAWLNNPVDARVCIGNAIVGSLGLTDHSCLSQQSQTIYPFISSSPTPLSWSSCAC